jgi:hypothetical protein
MKKMNSFIRGVAFSGLALALASTLPAQTVTQGKAVVLHVKGDARYTVGKTGWKKLSVGDVLPAGTVVQTETKKGAYVDLILSDAGSGVSVTPVSFNPAAGVPPPSAAGGGYTPAIDQNVVRLWENTVLGVDKLTFEQTGADVVTDTQLDLKAGHIFGMVKKMSRTSKYEIKLPNGVAGIRGTYYELWASGKGSAYGGSMAESRWVPPPGTPTPIPPGTPTHLETIIMNGGEGYDPDTGLTTPIGQAWIDYIKSQVVPGMIPPPAPSAPPPSVPDLTRIYYVSPTK